MQVCLKKKAAHSGVKFSLMPLVHKAVSLALLQYPVVNSRLLTEETIHILPYHNIDADNPLHDLMKKMK